MTELNTTLARDTGTRRVTYVAPWFMMPTNSRFTWGRSERGALPCAPASVPGVGELVPGRFGGPMKSPVGGGAGMPLVMSSVPQ